MKPKLMRRKATLSCTLLVHGFRLAVFDNSYFQLPNVQIQNSVGDENNANNCTKISFLQLQKNQSEAKHKLLLELPEPFALHVSKSNGIELLATIQ